MSVYELKQAAGVINVVGLNQFILGKLLHPERRIWGYHAYCADVYSTECANLVPLFQDEYDAMFSDFGT